ncbi:MAG: hypothetical protein ABIO06_06295 [Pseudolysinimonas sp.]
MPEPTDIFRLLSTRKGDDYHHTIEKYGPRRADQTHQDQSEERKTQYRAAILNAAQQLRFIAQSPGSASDDLDRTLGILDSDMSQVESDVAAVVVNGAGGASSLKRVRDAARNIQAGRFRTQRLILTGGERPVRANEQRRIPTGFRRGTTEFELLRRAAEDLLEASFGRQSETLEVSYGQDLTAETWRGTGQVGTTSIELIAIKAPYDPFRILAESAAKAPRVNTEEVFLAAVPYVMEAEGGVVVQSHDTWTAWQHLIGKQVFELGLGRAVHPAGPMNDNRVIQRPDGHYDIVSAEDVVDEIAKTYLQLFATRDMFSGVSTTGESEGLR